MRITNNFDIPEVIVRAVSRRNAMYDRGAAHRSATQLILPPRIDALRKKHYADMTKDVSEEIWALFGSAVHYILELGVNHNQTAEERLFAEVDGWTISGALDCQTTVKDGTVEITDYKVTNCFKVMNDDDDAKREWIEQLNIQAYLVETNKNVKVSKLTIVAILRDWQRSASQRDPLYPAAPIVPIELPLWTRDRQEAFIKERIALHRLAEMNIELGLPLPECTREERWSRGDRFAIKKVGGKRATQVCSTREEAVAVLAAMGDGFEIEERLGRSIRCEENYCGVAEWCDQFRGILGKRSDQSGEAGP